VTIFFAILLTVLTFAYITYPLFKQKLRPVSSDEDEKLRELHSRRDTTLSMLKELEFDFKAGILTEEDYGDLEARYKKKGVSILRSIDELAKSTNVEEEIEKQIMELRQQEGQFCPQCGAKYQEGDSFCSRCGTSLRRGEHAD
jgi:hypothetical protein